MEKKDKIRQYLNSIRFGGMFKSHQDAMDQLPEDSRCSYKKGTRVIKINSNPTDTYEDGSKGVIFGSCYVAEYQEKEREGYMVMFDKPKLKIRDSKGGKVFRVDIVPGYKLQKDEDHKSD